MGVCSGLLHSYRMAVNLNFIPVTPRTGGEVHATSLDKPGSTACNREFRGWKVVPHKLTCQQCKERLHLPVKPNEGER